MSSGSTAAAGTYAVEITAAATKATLLGSGFDGTYNDSGASDYITISDEISGSSTQVQLVNLMTTQQLVDALNEAFAETVKRKIQTANVLYSDNPPTTEITTGTTFDSIFASDATPANVSAGDTISYSGARPNGTLFAGEFQIDEVDPANTTIGDLVDHLQQAIGTTVTVSVSGGRIVVEDTTGGISETSLSLIYDGDGALNFGPAEVETEGRYPMTIVAEAVGNEIQLTHSAYGASAGFTIAYTGDETGQLGLAANTYNGVDVAGTIGGYAATGSGQQLIGDSDTVAAGLHIQYTGTTVRSAGDVTLTLGTGATIERLLDQLLEVGTGVLDVRDESITDRIDRMELRIDTVEERVARKRAMLIRRYTTMEMLIGQLQVQSQAIGSQAGTIFNFLGASNR